MALSDSLAALNTHRWKTWSLQLIKTALAISQYKRSDRSVQISATLDVGLGGVMEKTERLTNRRVKTASGSTQRCRREMKTLIAPGEEMKWSENTPHGNPPSLQARSPAALVPSPRLSLGRMGTDLSASCRAPGPCFLNCTDETGWLLINAGRLL